MRISFRLLIILVFASNIIYSQQVGVWKNYTNMENVADAIVFGNGLWSATSGGAFYLDLSDSSYKILNISDYGSKASSINLLTSISIAPDKKIWFGNKNGIINIFNPSSENFSKRITDIYNSSQSQKKVNEILFKGDTAFVSTDFGVSLVDADSFYFYDSYIKFGSFQSNSKVFSVLISDRMYVATENGIAILKSFNLNPTDPDSWTTFTTNQGLPSNTVNKLLLYNGSVIAATSKGLAKFDGSVWTPYLTQLSALNILDIYASGSTLKILTSGQLYSYSGALPELEYTTSGPVFSGIAGVIGKDIFISSASGLLKITESANPESQLYAPNCPKSSIFRGLAVDIQGNLWSGSGTQTPPAIGFYKMDRNNYWTNYDKSQIDKSNNNTFYNVYAAPDGAIYVMNWGEGFVRFKDNKFTHFSYYNTPLTGITSSPNYVVMSDAAADSRGNIWLLSYATADKKPLSVLTSDDSLTLFSNEIDNEVIQGYQLLVDDNDTKWMVVGSEGSTTGQEIYYYNENKTFYTTDVKGWGKLTKSDGLNSDIINTIALDNNGELWIGGSAGINILSNTSYPQSTLSDIYSMSNQNVTSIAVDALDQKWLGTNQGVFLFSSDGSKLISYYNTDNCPLPDNSILSIAVDNNTGTVYFGTENGLASYTTTAVTPRESFSDLLVSPNPLILSGNSDADVMIDGLIKDSKIKILSISGKLIREFSSDGGRIAQWDGRDENGDLVPSGVYIIAAFDADGNNAATAKIAVIKK